MELALAVHHLMELLEDRGEDVSSIQQAVAEMNGDYATLQQSIFDQWKTDKTAVIFTLSKTFFTNYIKNYIKDPDVNLFELYERPRILLVTNEIPSPSLLTSFQQKDKFHQTTVPTTERPILQQTYYPRLQYCPLS